MQTHRCHLNYKKETEQKLRWDEDLDGVIFKLYIPKWRVPEPWPDEIIVQVLPVPPKFDGNSVPKATDLLEAGIEWSEISMIGKWLPIVRVGREAEPQIKRRPVTTIVVLDREHTETVRYHPFGDEVTSELGQPYVPKSVPGTPYAERLLMRVDWVQPSQ